jgi:hypothetical protein
MNPLDTFGSTESILRVETFFRIILYKKFTLMATMSKSAMSPGPKIFGLGCVTSLFEISFL